MRQLGHSDLGVAHRCRRVTIDRAKVALTINQRITQREGLRHSHYRVVNGRIAVRVVLTDDVTDNPGRLFVSLVPVVVELIHRE